MVSRTGGAVEVGVGGRLTADGRRGTDDGLLKGVSSGDGVSVFMADPIMLATGACGRGNCVCRG